MKSATGELRPADVGMAASSKQPRQSSEWSSATGELGAGCSRVLQSCQTSQGQRSKLAALGCCSLAKAAVTAVGGAFNRRAGSWLLFGTGSLEKRASRAVHQANWGAGCPGVSQPRQGCECGVSAGQAGQQSALGEHLLGQSSWATRSMTRTGARVRTASPSAQAVP